jgi:hypothetical protein
MAHPLAVALQRLLDADQPVLASQFTPAQRRELDALRQKIGGIACQIQGKAIRYQPTDRQRLLNYLRQIQPYSATTDLPHLPQRAQNLGQSRHTKSGSSAHTYSYLLLKSVSADVIWHNHQQCLPLTTLTAQHGVAALQIHTDDAWSSQQPLWLVENQALFDQPDWLPCDATGSLLYYAGQLSNRLLDWLAAQPRGSALILFADYDGVGLSNFVRLQQRCPQAQFWLMPHWHDKLARYGNEAIWKNTHGDFVRAYAQLLAQLDHIDQRDSVLTLCQQLQQHGLALEQEAVWW